MLLKNCYYLDDTGNFKQGDILLLGEKIEAVGSLLKADDEVIDLKGKRVIPGLIDIHLHGALGYDTMTATPEQIQEIARYLARVGTTSFLPTTITADMAEIKAAVGNVKAAAASQVQGSAIAGVHIEGPYLNELHKGCHDTTKMKKSDISEYEEMRKLIGDLRMHITIAPELEGSLEFIKYVRNNNDTISIGHTNANYNEVNDALNAGASIFTHLFNGMRGIHHREPGTAGSALLSDAYVELICDGVHVERHIVEMLYRMKGRDKIVLVTDAMLATGLGDGEFMFGGFKVIVKDGIARKEDGSLASSTLTLFKAVKNIMKFTGASFEAAVQMASINPAKAVGIDDITGSIQTGKRADLIIVDNNMEIEQVFVKGKKVDNQ